MNVLKVIKEGKKLQTRDGNPVRVLCTDLKGVYPVAVAVDYGNKEVVNQVSLDGESEIHNATSNCDLMIVPTQLWFNVYRTNAGDIINGTRKFYNSKKEAEKAAELESMTMQHLGTFSVCV